MSLIILYSVSTLGRLLGSRGWSEAVVVVSSSCNMINTGHPGPLMVQCSGAHTRAQASQHCLGGGG